MMKKIQQNFAIIVAMDKNRVIGKDGKMPWHIPGDLKNFRQLTMGNPIVMGRKTHQSIGKILDGRENVILTRNTDFECPGCVVLHSVEEVLRRYDGKTVYIIGGAEIYRQFLPIVNFLYITYIDDEVGGDTFFPKIDWGNWELVYKTAASGHDPLLHKKSNHPISHRHKYYFTKYKRKG